MRNLALEFRCECARLDCSLRLPLEVERHRRSGDRFIVGLAHGDVDIVVGVADHFLVVDETERSHLGVAHGIGSHGDALDRGLDPDKDGIACQS
jgi:hypothetical protein